MHTPQATTELAHWTVAEVRRLLEILLPLPSYSAQFHKAWSDWRRRKRQDSRLSYRRRGLARLADHPPKGAKKRQNC